LHRHDARGGNSRHPSPTANPDRPLQANRWLLVGEQRESYPSISRAQPRQAHVTCGKQRAMGKAWEGVQELLLVVVVVAEVVYAVSLSPTPPNNGDQRH
jgi:hypothetical protein